MMSWDDDDGAPLGSVRLSGSQATRVVHHHHHPNSSSTTHPTSSGSPSHLRHIFTPSRHQLHLLCPASDDDTSTHGRRNHRSHEIESLSSPLAAAYLPTYLHREGRSQGSRDLIREHRVQSQRQ